MDVVKIAYEIYMDKYRKDLMQNKKLALFASLVRERIRKDRDCVIALTGTEGEGKSSAAIALAILFSDIDTKFDLEKNIAYLPDSTEVMKQFNAIGKYETFIVDEAIKSLLSYEYMAQTMLIKMYATERYQNKISILCMPRFKNFTENFRNYRINIWCHIYERGSMVVCVKDSDKDTEDPWHVKDNQKIKRKAYHNTPIAERNMDIVYRAEKKLANYFMLIQDIPKLPYVIEEEYKRLKRASRKIIEEEEAKKDGGIWKKRADWYMSVLQKLALMIRLSGMPDKYLSEYILKLPQKTYAEWLNSFISSSKLEAKEIIKLSEIFQLKSTYPSPKDVKDTFLMKSIPNQEGVDGVNEDIKIPDGNIDTAEYKSLNSNNIIIKEKGTKPKRYTPAPIPGIPSNRSEK